MSSSYYFSNTTNTTSSLYNTTSTLDGLTEDEFRHRYAEALWKRHLGVQNCPERESALLNLAGGPSASLEWRAAAEAANPPFWDEANWLRFLHDLTYKPGWRLSLDARSWDHRLRAEVSFNANPVASQYTPWWPEQFFLENAFPGEIVRTEGDAMRIVDRMIHECECYITKKSLRLRGAAVAQ